MSSTSSSPSKRYWPLAAAVLAGVASLHFLRDPAPSARRLPAERDEREPATDVPKGTEPRAVDTPSAPNRPLTATSPAAPADEVARNVVGALPQGEREAQRLQVLEIEALVRSGRIGSARAQAAAYFERWPGGPDTIALETLTGAHPRADRPAP